MSGRDERKEHKKRGRIAHINKLGMKKYSIKELLENKELRTLLANLDHEGEQMGTTGEEGKVEDILSTKGKSTAPREGRKVSVTRTKQEKHSKETLNYILVSAVLSKFKAFQLTGQSVEISKVLLYISIHKSKQTICSTFYY